MLLSHEPQAGPIKQSPWENRKDPSPHQTGQGAGWELAPQVAVGRSAALACRPCWRLRRPAAGRWLAPRL